MMKSFPRGLVLVCLALGASTGVAACGGLTVNYEGTRGPKRPKADLPVYDVDCADVVTTTLDCQYQGAPIAWKAVGIFRIPTKANGKWDTFRTKVIDGAASAGCPAVVIRKFPPSKSDGTAIGAFCVDTTVVNIPVNGGPQQGGIGISLSASATIAPPRIECNGPSNCPPGMQCVRGVCSQ